MKCFLGFHDWEYYPSRQNYTERVCLQCGRTEDTAYDGWRVGWKKRRGVPRGGRE